jgi:hypothetical protein
LKAHWLKTLRISVENVFVDAGSYGEMACRADSAGNIAPCAEDIAQPFQGQGKVAVLLI